MSQNYSDNSNKPGKGAFALLCTAIVFAVSLTACNNTPETARETPKDSVAILPPVNEGDMTAKDPSAVSPDTLAAPQDNVTVAADPIAVDTAKKVAVTPAGSKATSEEPKPAAKRKPKKENTEKDVVELPEQGASPVGGYPAFYKYIRANLQYPAEAKQKGVEGKVSVQFIVNTDGSLSNVKVASGIGAGCDEEALRVVQQAPNWEPALHKGVPVRHKTTIYIVFKLN